MRIQRYLNVAVTDYLYFFLWSIFEIRINTRYLITYVTSNRALEHVKNKMYCLISLQLYISIYIQFYKISKLKLKSLKWCFYL